MRRLLKYSGNIIILFISCLFLAFPAEAAKIYKIKSKAKRIYVKLSREERTLLNSIKKVVITKDENGNEFKGRISKLYKSPKASIYVGKKVSSFKVGDELTIDPAEGAMSKIVSAAKKVSGAVALRGGYVSASIPGAGLDIAVKVSQSGWVVFQAWGGLSSTPLSSSENSAIETTKTSANYTAVVLNYRLLTAADFVSLTLGFGQRIHSVNYTIELGDSTSESKLEISSTCGFAALGSQLSFGSAFLFIDWVQAAFPLSSSATATTKSTGGFDSGSDELEQDSSEQAKTLSESLTLAVAVLGLGVNF